MPKPIQLHIPKPCDADWNKMEKTEQGRFCLSCQKQVIDFSRMSDREILEYISKTKTDICGHFYPDQLNRKISVAKERKLGWFRYFIHVMIPAMIFVNRAPAQGKIKGDTVMVQSIRSNALSGELSSSEQNKKGNIIKGRIVDEETGEPIPFCTIVIKGSKHGTAADLDGNFRIDVSEPGDIILQIFCVGYENKESKIHVAGDQELGSMAISIATRKTSSGGLVVVATTSRKKNDTTICQKIRNMILAPAKINDTVKVYPNPVSAGALINLAFDVNKTGEYSVIMISVSGQSVLQKKIFITDRKQVEQFYCNSNLTNGIYTIQVTNLSTKKIFTNKVLVL